MQSVCQNAKRLVVKVGSALVTASGCGLDLPWLRSLVQQLVLLQQQNYEVILVSSGSIAAGMNALKLNKRPRVLDTLQAAAAVGQMRLSQVYQDFFLQQGSLAAQVLLTHDDLSRKRYLNARATLSRLLKLGVAPIVNENDTISTDEIRLGDNDTLAAVVAHIVDADVLVILTDQEGLFTSDPRRDPEAKLIDEIDAEHPKLLQMAGGSGSAVGTGGMQTKVVAARNAAKNGISTVIASGRCEQVLSRLVSGERIGSCLWAKPVGLDGKKQWLLGQVAVSGTFELDAGAVKALLLNGRSLLPVGIVGVSGEFDRGDVVNCFDSGGNLIARGMSNYASQDVLKIAGKPSAEIENILGLASDSEVIHRDNLVINPA